MRPDPLPAFDCVSLVASRLMLAASAFLLAIALPETAVASPKKALSEYSQLCQDEHLKCLNDCQKNYSVDADIRACFGVCDDWLDDACDAVFPKALVRNPGSVRPPLGGVLTPGTVAPRRVPKVTPGAGIAQ